MREHNLTAGGESSGHIVLLEHNVTGDAIIAALQILAILIRRDQPLSVLAGAYQPLPEAHVTVPLKGNGRPSESALDAIRQEGAEALGGVGRVVIRASGTEPIVRVMVQHDRLREAEHLAKELAGKVGAL